MRAQRDEQIAGCVPECLVRGHERRAAGVAEQDDGLDAGLLTEPPDAGADVHERGLEDEVRAVAAEARVPPEEAVPARGR